MMFPKERYSKQRKKRRANRAVKTTRKEEVLQKECEEVVDRIGVEYIRIPDAIYGFCMSRGSNAIKALVGKYLQGINDLVILYNGRYIVVEFKRDAKEKLTTGQKSFRQAVGIEYCYRANTLNEFLEILRENGIVAE